MAGQFEYQNLVESQREIRLLRLLPKDNQQNGSQQPVCRIFNTKLHECPSFVALSYVWGNQDNRKVILVDGLRFYVTRNLFNALIELRKTEDLTIWIDAICINQQDKEEKRWQVELMGDIYREASEVIAWLGTSADDSDTVIDYLNVLGGKAEVCGLHNGPQVCLQEWLMMTITPSYMNDPNKVVFIHQLDGRTLPVSKLALERLLDSVSGWKSQNHLFPTAGLKRLFLRAWWGRIWVLQEITLPEHAYFACGTKRISRRRLQAAFNTYYGLWSILASQIQRQQTLTSYQTEVFLMATHRVNVMLSTYNVYRSDKFPLVALLRATCVGGVRHLRQDGFQHLESTNPRDKIFALLGLAGDQEELKTLGVSPDYTKSKEDVYVTAMSALLQQGHTSILSFCRHSETSDGLPSWVIDWSRPMQGPLQDVEPDHLTLYPKFNACASRYRDQIVLPRPGQKPRHISVMAIVHDKIFQVGKVSRLPLTGTCSSPIDWLYGILKLTYDADNIYANFKERLQAVVRTSHAAIGNGEAAFLKRVDRFFDALPIFKSEIHSIKRRNIKRDLQSFLDSKDTRYLLERKQGDSNKLFQDFMRITSGRSSFVAENGRLGLSSESIRQGDIIAVISGSQVPFILRQCKSRGYRIISEAYVDGIMDGEATEEGEWGYIELV